MVVLQGRMDAPLATGADATMGLFSRRCDSCGALVELPGRFGFKIKGGGASPMLCQHCRQTDWMELRRRQPGVWSQRTVPMVAAGLAALMMLGGVWWNRVGAPLLQDRWPTTESPSR